MFISCTAWHHVYYDYLTITSSVQLPGQLLKVCADRCKMVACENIIIAKFKMREIALPARECGR